MFGTNTTERPSIEYQNANPIAAELADVLTDVLTDTGTEKIEVTEHSIDVHMDKNTIESFSATIANVAEKWGYTHESRTNQLRLMPQ